MTLPGRRPRVIAHRGASGYAPELTRAAFHLALEFGVDAIELDVRMSRDGEIVVIHDRLLNRTTDGQGPVQEMTSAQLKELDAGSWFNRAFPSRARPEYARQEILFLGDVFDLIDREAVILFVEIKDPEVYPPDLEARILSIVRRKGFAGRVALLSFDAGSLAKVKELAADVRTVLLVNDLRSDPVETALAVGADEIAIRFTLLSDGLSGRIRAAGRLLSVWTVDDEQDLRRMIDAGVDGITSNYPDRVMRIMNGTRGL